MLTKNNENQPKVELVLIENLVKKDHILRRIDEHIDFNFIYDIVEDKYCLDNGRPSIDPVVLFKIILLIGYLFGIRSERRLIEEIEEIHHNVAYRWFLGYGLEDKIPDASTISQNRRRRFTGTDIFEKIFDNIVGQVALPEYVDELEKAVTEAREAHGQKELKKNKKLRKKKQESKYNRS